MFSTDASLFRSDRIVSKFGVSVDELAKLASWESFLGKK
jgi:hypothetical protein